MIRLGKNQLRMFEFFRRLGERRLHSLTKDRATQEAAKGLQRKGFIEINEYGQAEYTGKQR